MGPMTDFGGLVGPAAPGALLAGRYRLTGRLGGGGMGTVWRATDERMRRQVALKEPILPDGVDPRHRDELLHRMEREAQAAAGLRHPNVVRVHDIETVDGRPWLVMELIEGESLESWFAAGTVGVAETASIGRQLASALAAVHAAGVVHRDVKPANIMRTAGGEVILTDFGIAQVEGGVDLTRTGTVVGSIPYLSPERATGARPTPAADLWALGLVLYEALEGVHPYRRQSTQGTLAAILQDPVPAPRRAGALTGPVTALLERDPARRPTAAQALELFAPEPVAPTATVRLARPAPTPAAPTPAWSATAADAPPGTGPGPGSATAPGASGSAAGGFARSRRGRTVLVAAALALVAAAGTSAWLTLGPDSAPAARRVPAGFTSHRVPALGLGIALPEGYVARIGADGASWSSPDTHVQITVRDEGKATGGAVEHARARLTEVAKGQGTFCTDGTAPQEFHVRVVREPQSVRHGGGVDAQSIEYGYSTLSEDKFPCLDYPPANEAMEEYMVRDGRLLHLTATFVLNYVERTKKDNGPANQKLFAAVDDSMNFG